MSGYILAIDQGTTSLRAIVIDNKLAIKSLGQEEFKQFYKKWHARGRRFDLAWLHHSVSDKNTVPL